MTTPVVEMAIEEWREAVVASGNGDPLQARIRCPLCKNIATPQQFKDAGVDPEKAFQNCIGRFTEAKGNLHSKRPTPQPCDWAAYGLFGTLREGIRIRHEDGHTTWVFSFADEVTS